MKNAAIGQFFPGDSFLYRLDPRAKLILTVALIVLVFIIKSFVGFGLIFLFIFCFPRNLNQEIIIPFFFCMKT